MWLFTLKKIPGSYRQMFVRVKNSHTYKIDMGSIVTISVLYLVFGHAFFLTFLAESGFCLIKSHH